MSVVNQPNLDLKHTITTDLVKYHISIESRDT